MSSKTDKNWKVFHYTSRSIAMLNSRFSCQFLPFCPVNWQKLGDTPPPNYYYGVIIVIHYLFVHLFSVINKLNGLYIVLRNCTWISVMSNEWKLWSIVRGSFIYSCRQNVSLNFVQRGAQGPTVLTWNTIHIFWKCVYSKVSCYE